MKRGETYTIRYGYRDDPLCAAMIGDTATRLVPEDGPTSEDDEIARAIRETRRRIADALGVPHGQFVGGGER